MAASNGILVASRAGGGRDRHLRRKFIDQTDSESIADVGGVKRDSEIFWLNGDYWDLMLVVGGDGFGVGVVVRCDCLAQPGPSPSPRLTPARRD